MGNCVLAHRTTAECLSANPACITSCNDCLGDMKFSLLGDSPYWVQAGHKHSLQDLLEKASS